MKTCLTCFSTAFEDMTICYGCLEPFETNAAVPLSGTAGIQHPKLDSGFFPTDDEFAIEETPDSRAAPTADAALAQTDAAHVCMPPFMPSEAIRACGRPNAHHFRITESGTNGYDIYLLKKDGQELVIGNGHDDDDASSQSCCQAWMLRIYFDQGQVWMEDKQFCHKAVIDGTGLAVPRTLHPGATVEIANFRIMFIG